MEYSGARLEADPRHAPARALSGSVATGSTFKYVEILKTRRKPNHSHPEVEILLVLSGRGTRIIGDSIGEFREGDLYVLGSQLLHTFFPSPTDRAPVKTLVIQFQPGDLKPALAAFPEFRGFDELLAKARRGLSVLDGTREAVAAMMHRIGAHPPSSPKRLSLFMAILAELGESEELAVAGGPKLLPLRNGRMDEKLDIVCRLIQNNLIKPLAQAAMAGHVGMSPAAFSRWFRRNMGKPYTDYVNEARIDLAGQALVESDRDIVRISQEYGFAGESHFHRLFKSIKGMTPSEYRRLSRPDSPVRSASLR
jgi:AraC-like DNA-binding protein